VNAAERTRRVERAMSMSPDGFPIGWALCVHGAACPIIRGRGIPPRHAHESDGLMLTERDWRRVPTRNTMWYRDG
jgi:hypothetical protein